MSSKRVGRGRGLASTHVTRARRDRTRDPATYGSEVLAVADALVVTAIELMGSPIIGCPVKGLPRLMRALFP
jgi:hypothetical protein